MVLFNVGEEGVQKHSEHLDVFNADFGDKGLKGGIPYLFKICKVW